MKFRDRSRLVTIFAAVAIVIISLVGYQVHQHINNTKKSDSNSADSQFKNASGCIKEPTGGELCN